MNFKSALEQFPNFELSYENITHKKVYNSDIILAIPDGIKHYAWFTIYNSNPVCLLLELNNSKIANVNICSVVFDNLLTIGTIFYGTLLKYNNINCFCIEDIYYYKGKNYTKISYLHKLELLETILRDEIRQPVLNNRNTIFGLPVLHKDFNVLLNTIQTLPYKISHLKHRFFDKNNSRKILTMIYFKPKETIKIPIQNQKKSLNKLNKAIFKVTANIEPDIYNLFILKNNKEEYYDTAFIPDYKTSVMMNRLFRNIKENDNLDAIEESDDEEEFQNNKEDKFVYLDKVFKFNCEYNHKFKRWVPVSLAKDTDIIVSDNNLIC